MNRRQLFRNAVGLAGAAVIAPSILNEALPIEELTFDRVAVEVFEQGVWSRIAGLDYVKAGQIYRFLRPDTLEHIVVHGNVDIPGSWFAIATEDGTVIQNSEGRWVGGAFSEFYPKLEDAQRAVGKR